MAEWFRNALREARDAPAMLAVSQHTLAVVEQLAGTDRADASGERLAKLLPESAARGTQTNRLGYTVLS